MQLGRFGFVSRAGPGWAGRLRGNWTQDEKYPRLTRNWLRSGRRPRPGPPAPAIPTQTGVSLSIPGVSDGPGPCRCGGDPIPRADPTPAPSEPGRPPPFAIVRLCADREGAGRLAPAVRPRFPRARRRTNPSPAATGLNPSRGADRTRAAGAERTRAPAPNEPEPRRRTNPSVRLLSATLRSRAAPSARGRAGDPLDAESTGRPDGQRTPAGRGLRVLRIRGRGPGVGWATRERTDSRNREGHPQTETPPGPRAGAPRASRYGPPARTRPRRTGRQTGGRRGSEGVVAGRRTISRVRNRPSQWPRRL